MDPVQRAMKAAKTRKKRKRNVLWLSNEEKKRTKVITIIILILCLLLLLSPWLIWYFSNPNDVHTVIYNKTVPDDSFRQHAALMWFLKHTKVQTEQGTNYKLERDYLGLHRNKSSEDNILPLHTVSEQIDVLYIADTYGIYAGEPGRSLPTPGTSNVLYGGLDDKDVKAIREFLAQKRPNTLIAEYNTFGTPTRDHIRSEMYEIMRLRWTGWIGQYVADLALDANVPGWFRQRYEISSGKPWDYSGEGIILADEQDHVVVLTMAEDLDGKGNSLVYTSEANQLLYLEGSHPYNKIFDIVEPLDGSTILANYELDVTSSGQKKLIAEGLPSTFPAIIASDTAYHRSYYFAGNFADIHRMPNFHFIASIDVLMRKFTTNSMQNETGFFWHTYIPLMSAIYQEAETRKHMTILPPSFEIYNDSDTLMVARTYDHMLQVYENNQWNDLFIHGVNIGIAMPGKWFTDFPNDMPTYYRWLQRIGELGANTVRIYTLLDPQFYNAFALYNEMNPEKKLWLMQEIWPEEHPPGNDYLDDLYQSAYEQEIRWVIDAIHGNACIAERRGRAYGDYTSDVSPYVIGYLVGRELEPVEVEQTDILNAGYTFEGRYLSVTPEASPTEAWLAQSADAALAYEEQTYGWQHPVSIVSWPTLDVIDHESERDETGKKEREFNDRAVVDINHIMYGPAMKGGLFGSYHIYPNYPDFMNNDPLYNQYYDEKGRFRYGGYLQEFMQHHSTYPAVVAEFGIATGLGNAHISPDGYHHGSLSEFEQAEGIIRMFEAMRREGYAGGIIFEWMDEWAKKTWVTEPYMIPYDRHILWHNAIDPEQNYGLMALESVKPAKVQASLSGNGLIKHIDVRSDVSYLWIDIELSNQNDLTSRPLFIGVDTYDRARGEVKYLSNIDALAPSGMEYLIVLDGEESSRLLVIPPYDYTKYHFASYQTLEHSARFQTMEKLVNKARALADGNPIPAKFEDSSHLRFGPMDMPGSHWWKNDNHITIRIPWTRMNVSDPSQATVLDDQRTFFSDPERDVLSTTISDGIAISTIIVDMKKQRVVDSLPVQGSSDPFVMEWIFWNQPTYHQRLKQSFPILQQYFYGVAEED